MGMRVFFCFALLLLLVLIVISPYVDLPPTTLRAWQRSIALVTLLVCALAIARGGSAPWKRVMREPGQQPKPLPVAAGEEFRTTCAVRC